ncbi:MAG: glutamine-hydrolyzing GMP synthase [Ignavibacteriales bacterium]|nr:glutamine-hydrolyzing GMP synthase [Ignavibacteriales bacterium]
MGQKETILILDFGSQYTQLIARKIREHGVYSEIHPHTFPLERVKAMAPKGIVLSGGPTSVYDDGAPDVEDALFDLGVPMLGVCYGLQLMSRKLGGVVSPAEDREYGKATVRVVGKSAILQGVSEETTVWMSHGDLVEKPPEGAVTVGVSDNSPHAVVADEANKRYGLQFHPEVAHTPEGKTILRNFLFDVCGCAGDWTPASFVEETIETVRAQAPEGNVILGLSGGVDSTVAAGLLERAFGERLHCIHVDNGLMRLNESAQIVEEMRRSFPEMRLRFVDASKNFLRALEGVVDPEEKRKIIGKEFIDAFDREAEKIPDVRYLAQGTLYPDVIESVSVKGKSHTIKSHHNVGGLPETMKLELIEPLRELFKDEVRRVGRDLGAPESLIGRHPFPGPGLGVRVLGEITEERLEALRRADDVYIRAIKDAGIYDEIWQAFAVLLPVRTVGVMGDARTYENVIALRAVVSSDGMTADWYRHDHEFLADVSNKIINSVKGVNRVVYDVSSKPPSTIEWE